MGSRFDEVELLREPEPPSTESVAAMLVSVASTPVEESPAVEERRVVEPGPRIKPASRFHRALALLTDLSLFLALALALSPLLPFRGDWRNTLAEEWPLMIALGGFLLIVSYYYFVTSWMIWGKTVGGAIFDVRVISEEEDSVMTARDMTRRWMAMLLSILLCGTGFLLALLPGARSLADRMSHTRAIQG